MGNVMSYKEEVVKEITEIPEEFIPLILEQVKAFKNNLKRGINNKKSPTKRLLNLAGSLENPESLSAKEYKQKTINERLKNYK